MSHDADVQSFAMLLCDHHEVRVALEFATHESSTHLGHAHLQDLGHVQIIVYNNFKSPCQMDKVASLDEINFIEADLDLSNAVPPNRSTLPLQKIKIDAV